MAALTQSLSTADALLKDTYVGPIIDQVNRKTYLLDQIERDSDHIDNVGRRAIFPVETDFNRGRGSIADGGTLPDPGRAKYADAILAMRYHTAGLELTDALIETANGNNTAAFVGALDREAKSVADSLRKTINRQAFGDGTGLLGTISANANSATQALDSVQYVAIGDPVDVLTKSDGTSKGANILVTDRSASGKTITLASSVNATTADGVYLSGSRNQEMDGLRNIVAASRTLHSINSATAGNGYWNASTKSAGSATAGEDLFEQLADLVGASGQGEVEVFLTSRGIRRRLANTYSSQKRYNDAKAVEVHGGYTAIMVNEIPVVSDDDAPKGYAFGINRESFRWAELAKPDWLKQEDGSVWTLAPGSTLGTYKAAWRAYFRWYAALACLAPNRNGVITSAADDDPT